MVGFQAVSGRERRRTVLDRQIRTAGHSSTDRSVDELVLFGHEPDLSTLVSFLISRPGGFNFKKGAAIKLKIDPSNLPASTAFKWLACGKKLVGSLDEAMTL
jgi:phosphohistidine phosphatase SixA